MMPSKSRKRRQIMQRITLKIQEETLGDVAREIVSAVSSLDTSRSKELISSFLFEMASASAEHCQREERRQKQAEGITAAKASGVQSGRPRAPLPDVFDECYQAWQDGELSLRKAAESCGIGRTSFRRAALRRKEDGEEAAQAAV